MCWYHVTFHLDFEFEHTLDVNSSGDHRVQVWSRSSHSPARSDFRDSIKVPYYVTFDLDFDLEHILDAR